jgi:hypothetical protein
MKKSIIKIFKKMTIKNKRKRLNSLVVRKNKRSCFIKALHDPEHIYF